MNLSSRIFYLAQLNDAYLGLLPILDHVLIRKRIRSVTINYDNAIDQSMREVDNT